MTIRALTLIWAIVATAGATATAQQPLPAPDQLVAQAGQPRPQGQQPQAQPPQGQQRPGQPPQPGQPGPPDGQPGPVAPQPAPPGYPRPRPENAATNIQVEVTITDARPGAAPITKSVTIVTSDGLNGSVRSESNVPGFGNTPFNVDSVPVILADGKIHTRVTVQYGAAMAGGAGSGGSGTQIRDSVALVLQSGKAMVAVQSTDPASERKVSVEVKATILR